jgi:hypothetical protein
VPPLALSAPPLTRLFPILGTRVLLGAGAAGLHWSVPPVRHYLGIALALGLRPSYLDNVSAPEKDVSGSRLLCPRGMLALRQ